MALCHQTLSRSQLNAISKLKDAGIITNNLVVLPNTSNTCLANNGTHVSIGSTVLSRLAADRLGGMSSGVEKYVGDLVVKIVEHFLPLFVNTYTAAPYRVDFADFHPEKVLGFLPHELDYTHLRMLWRRWKKKADIRFLGKSLTPFGPRRLDGLLARMLRLHGDLIPDFRLVDHFITLLSTESCPALNGIPGNQEQLKMELTELGIFDSRMSIYLPYRQRHYDQLGYTGFEGRSYSLFPSFMTDMAEAVDLQNLITAFAYSLILRGRVSHHDIPDEPSVESERRQIFFASAIGVPTVYIRTATQNRFLGAILAHVDDKRSSRRYRNYTRVRVDDLRLPLVGYLQLDAGCSAWARLTREAADSARARRVPERMPADQFNSATENYYRSGLRKAHLGEGLSVLEEDCLRLERMGDANLKVIMADRAPGMDVRAFLAGAGPELLSETCPPETLKTLVHLSLAAIDLETRNH